MTTSVFHRLEELRARYFLLKEGANWALEGLTEWCSKEPKRTLKGVPDGYARHLIYNEELGLLTRLGFSWYRGDSIYSYVRPEDLEVLIQFISSLV